MMGPSLWFMTGFLSASTSAIKNQRPITAIRTAHCYVSIASLGPDPFPSFLFTLSDCPIIYFFVRLIFGFWWRQYKYDILANLYAAHCDSYNNGRITHNLPKAFSFLCPLNHCADERPVSLIVKIKCQLLESPSKDIHGCPNSTSQFDDEWNCQELEAKIRDLTLRLRSRNKRCLFHFPRFYPEPLQIAAAVKHIHNVHVLSLKMGDIVV